jgi:hypothetical protein
VREPVIQLGPAIGFRNTLDAEPYLGQGHDADMKLVERTSGDESHNPLFRPWPTQFGEDIGIEQPRH